MLRNAGLSRIVLMSALLVFAAGSLTGCASLKSFTSKGMQLAGMKVAEVKQHAVTLNELDKELMRRRAAASWTSSKSSPPTTSPLSGPNWTPSPVTSPTSSPS